MKSINITLLTGLILSGCGMNPTVPISSAEEWVKPVTPPKSYASTSMAAQPLFDTYLPGDVKTVVPGEQFQSDDEPSENVAERGVAITSAQQGDDLIALRNRIAELEQKLDRLSREPVVATNEPSQNPETPAVTTERELQAHASVPVALPALSMPMVSGPIDIVSIIESREDLRSVLAKLDRVGHTDRFYSYSQTKQAYVLYLGRYNAFEDAHKVALELDQHIDSVTLKSQTGSIDVSEFVV